MLTNIRHDLNESQLDSPCRQTRLNLPSNRTRKLPGPLQRAGLSHPLESPSTNSLQQHGNGRFGQDVEGSIRAYRTIEAIVGRQIVT